MRLCSIASGSSGNCIYIGSDNTHLLFDVGLSGKRIEQGLNEMDLKTADIEGILITHEHIDHIGGLGVVARKYGIPIYATRGTINGILNTKSVGTIDTDLFRVINEDEKILIGDIEVEPIKTSHDAAQPVAYKVNHNGKKAAVVTDLGKYDDYIVDKIKDLDVLLLEANHDVNMLQVGSYPYYLKQRILGDRGHLSNENAGRLLCEVLHDDFKKVILGHVSKENNYEELAYETVRAEIRMSEVEYTENDFPIQVEKRDCVSAKIEF